MSRNTKDLQKDLIKSQYKLIHIYQRQIECQTKIIQLQDSLIDIHKHMLKQKGGDTNMKKKTVTVREYRRGPGFKIKIKLPTTINEAIKLLGASTVLGYIQFMHEINEQSLARYERKRSR